MNKLVHALASIIRDKVLDATKGRSGPSLESRFIFHGPPRELLEAVFDELAGQGGIRIPLGQDNTVLPVLLELPSGHLVGPNPGIGESGKCDENHLLHVRNDPNSPSFVALVPPGQHNNRSVASTTEEFGVGASNNTGHATFEQWWNDGFIQRLVVEGLHAAGLRDEEIEGAIRLVEQASDALDQMDSDEGTRNAVWRLLSRIYSIPTGAIGLPPGSAVALACGVPPMQDGRLAHALQLDVLAKVANEMADGLRTGIERISSSAPDTTKEALADLLAHLQANYDVPTAFERATPAFYLPADVLELVAPPSWWLTLTVECWSELISDEPGDVAADLSITCTNAILPVARGMPALVRDAVQLFVSAGDGEADPPLEVLLTGGSHGKVPVQLLVQGSALHQDAPPVTGQRSPITYKVQADGRKPATTRVISLASWIPGIIVTSRMASKLSPPRKARRANTSVDWESSLSLPGPGRYELLLLTAPGTAITEVARIPDDATETLDERKSLQVHQVRDDEYQVEIEADDRYQLEISYRLAGHDGAKISRTYITCEEAREEGCRSEFERLIKQNRQHSGRVDAKSVIQLDRNARCSSLQSWMLDARNAPKSFLPLVLADDYAANWAPPDWNETQGRILSRARFLHDPRPEAGLFQPPHGFIDAREAIAERIRTCVDDQSESGLAEAAPLGKWLARDPEFRAVVEAYVDSYTAWLASDREIACWVDVIAVCARESAGRTLARAPDAIILSPLHPLRLGWHCLAQQVLHEAVEGDDTCPCPAASILDPDCIPDLLTMALQSPSGTRGIDDVDFLSVECSSEYWSVLWNGARLGHLTERSRLAPFDGAFGLTIGGISSGFSPAQVGRALEDVTDLLAAKPIVSVVVSSAGGTTDACNEGLANWCATKFGDGEKQGTRQGVGPRILEIFDTRSADSQPDHAVLAALSEETGNRVRWYERQPIGASPDLGIIAQLDSAQPESNEVGTRSPIGMGGLIRHRVRRQLPGAFLSESRQALSMPPSGDVFADKVASCILALEGSRDRRVGLEFAPDVHMVSSMLEERNASFVAVSSSAIDPACFLGDQFKGAYLWDYDLPSYSSRAGDTSGYYLLSQIRDADREALKRVLEPLPGSKQLCDAHVEQILLEVARRGIPTVRGLSGDDTGATGDLGLFLAVRLLQDQFRLSGNVDSLLPVLSGAEGDASIAIIVPVDPFRGYLADLARALGKERKDTTLLRPDLLVVGMHVGENRIQIKLTPIEVKCRLGSTFGASDARDAVGQAKALSTLFRSIQERAARSPVWRLAFQHLLLSMVGFGLRVYSQHELLARQSARWAAYHERIAAEILGAAPGSIEIDDSGRLVVVDSSLDSGTRDHDGDGLAETIVISTADAGQMVSGDAQVFYDAVRAKVGDWRLLPRPNELAADPATDLPAPSEGMLDKERFPKNATHGSAESKATLAHAEDNPSTPINGDTAPVMSAGDASTGIVLSVGQTVDGFQPRSLSLNISDTRLNQLNIGVVGDLGTGKTQLLKSLIFQIATARQENRDVKPRLLVFDYKRDYSSPDFVAATGARVVKPSQLPLNLFDTTSMGESTAPWLDRFRFFADVLDKVYSGIGPVQRDKLKGAVRNAYDSCKAQERQPTIYDIHAEYRELLGSKSDSPMAIIDDLVDMEVFERDPRKTKSFDEFLDGIVVVSLDAMGQDDRSKNMLVAIMLNMFYENMLRTQKRPFLGHDPQLRVIDSYLLVDEADNIMRYEFDVLRKLLLQGREFGAGVILASQYLRHFKASATDYREPLLTWFIHKVPNVTSAELGALGFTSDLAELSERVKTLPNHHCLYKSFDVAGEVIRGLPFYELEKDRPGPE